LFNAVLWVIFASSQRIYCLNSYKKNSVLQLRKLACFPTLIPRLLSPRRAKEGAFI
jgi:hypothetical protein